MKKVVMVWTMEFDDEIPDDECYKIALEVQGQDRSWPNDDQIFITHDNTFKLTEPT